jgi:hypothetical protein
MKPQVVARDRLRSGLLGGRQPKRQPIQPLVGAAGGKFIDCTMRTANDVAGNEWGALASAILGMLQAALPLQHRPAVLSILGELAEDGFEVSLPVSGRTEVAWPVNPLLVSAINS